MNNGFTYGDSTHLRTNLNADQDSVCINSVICRDFLNQIAWMECLCWRTCHWHVSFWTISNVLVYFNHIYCYLLISNFQFFSAFIITNWSNRFASEFQDRILHLIGNFNVKWNLSMVFIFLYLEILYLINPRLIRFIERIQECFDSAQKYQHHI